MKKLLLPTMFIIIFLSGCSFTNFEMSNLMHPPKATGEMAEIQSLIEKTVGSDIIFKCPQNGEYKSAIIMHDIDGDGQEEAIAVYQVTAQDPQTHIMLIDKVEGNWQVAKNINSKNTDLDKICFGDINGDGRENIILGWSSYTNYEKELTVIMFNNEDYVALYPSETYSDVTVNDFNSDGKAEILTLSVSKRDSSNIGNNENRTARASLIGFKSESNEFNVIDSVLMDSTVVKYNNVQFGKLNEFQEGAVIDGTTDKSKTTTEIVYWDSSRKKLMAPLYNFQTFSSTAFLRDNFVQSEDINHDGIIEIPQLDLSYDGSDNNAVYVLSWFRYNTRNLTAEYVNSVIMNNNDFYIFVVPDEWKGSKQGLYKIKLEYDSSNRTMTIFEQVESNGHFVNGRKILEITLMPKNEYDGLKSKSEYVVLAQENNRVYASKVLIENGELALSKEEIKSRFKII